MNTQTKLAQVDAEIAELQPKLAEAQERRELLASVKPVCDAALTVIDKALDRLCLVSLFNEFGSKDIAAFKAAIDTKFKFMEDEITFPEIKALQVVKVKYISLSDSTNKAVIGAYFSDRPVQHKQLQVIIQELQAIGIKVGKPIANRSDVKGWPLRWGQDEARLFWTVGDGWAVEALKSGDKLKGQWEGFDLDQQLECNGIDIDNID